METRKTFCHRRTKSRAVNPAGHCSFFPTAFHRDISKRRFPDRTRPWRADGTREGGECRWAAFRFPVRCRGPRSFPRRPGVLPVLKHGCTAGSGRSAPSAVRRWTATMRQPAQSAHATCSSAPNRVTERATGRATGAERATCEVPSARYVDLSRPPPPAPHPPTATAPPCPRGPRTHLGQGRPHPRQSAADPHRRRSSRALGQPLSARSGQRGGGDFPPQARRAYAPRDHPRRGGCLPGVAGREGTSPSWAGAWYPPHSPEASAGTARAAPARNLRRRTDAAERTGFHPPHTTKAHIPTPRSGPPDSDSERPRRARKA